MTTDLTARLVLPIASQDTPAANDAAVTRLDRALDTLEALVAGLEIRLQRAARVEAIVVSAVADLDRLIDAGEAAAAGRRDFPAAFAAAVAGASIPASPARDAVTSMIPVTALDGAAHGPDTLVARSRTEQRAARG